MKGGVINVTKAKGDVYFLSREGKQVFDPLLDVEVKIDQDFPGISLKDSLAEAERFAVGAIKQKVQQNMRGKTCFPIVRDVDIRYKIKYGFTQEKALQRELQFKAGKQIIKKGDYGNEFFLIKEGKVEADKVIYHPGSVFGRAAFSDGIRKRNVYAKTDTAIIAINKDHPDIINKLPVILEKFSEEVKRIKKVRPRARLDKIKI
jgi:hypothetical protein